MTDTTKTTAPVGSGTPTPPSSGKPAMTDEDIAKQKEEIEIARAKKADEDRDLLDDIRHGSGGVQSLEGERPEYEPPIGTKPENPIPAGLVVGGPVLSLEDQEYLARKGKGPSQMPGTKPK